MNLHIVTENYATGESVTAELKYDDEYTLINGKKTLTVTDIVDGKGIATINKVFSAGTLNLKA